jgi:hypothetical protein
LRCKFSAFSSCSRRNPLPWNEKRYPKGVLSCGLIVVEFRNMRICQINNLIKRKRNNYCPIFFLTIKHNPPIFPIENCIQISFIKIVFIQASALIDPKYISLSDFTLNSNFSNSVLYFDICTSTPILIVLFASTNPMTLSINKISQRHQVNITIPWKIMNSIRTIMKFDIQLKLVKSGVNLFVSDGNRFD